MSTPYSYLHTAATAERGTRGEGVRGLVLFCVYVKAKNKHSTLALYGVIEPVGTTPDLARI